MRKPSLKEEHVEEAYKLKLQGRSNYYIAHIFGADPRLTGLKLFHHQKNLSSGLSYKQILERKGLKMVNLPTNGSYPITTVKPIKTKDPTAYLKSKIGVRQINKNC